MYRLCALLPLVGLLACTADPAFAHAAEQGFVLLLPTAAYAFGGTMTVAASIVLVTCLPTDILARLFRPVRWSRPVALRDVARMTSLVGAVIFLMLICVGLMGPAQASEILGTTLLEGRKVEILADGTWVYAEALPDDCQTVTSNLMLCAEKGRWTSLPAANADIAAQFRFDDSTYGLLILEELVDAPVDEPQIVLEAHFDGLDEAAVEDVDQVGLAALGLVHYIGVDVADLFCLALRLRLGRRYWTSNL